MVMRLQRRCADGRDRSAQDYERTARQIATADSVTAETSP